MKKNTYTTLLFGMALLLGVCSGSDSKQTTDTQESKPKVKLAAVKAQAVEQIVEYTATVEADIKNNIAPSTAVRIEKIFVEVGDYVRKGQKLVQMDASNLRQAKLQLDNQEAEFKRTDELYKVGGVSKSEWDAAKMNLDVRQTSYNNLLENTQLLSPIDGVITARNYDNGDMYGNGNPVLVVERISPVKLLINVSESYFPLIKQGASAKVQLDVYGDETFEGKISLVYPTIDATTHTFPVEVRVANANRRVRPGMFGRVTLNLGTKNHIVVPDMAVVKQAGAGDRYVYVYTDGKVTYNKVELGRRMGAEYELLSGVPNNSLVVIAGQSRLTNGVEVEVEE